MPFIAYKITHRESGKAYVGITVRTLEERWNSHFYKGNGRIGMAVRKYGRESFSIEQIASAGSLTDLLAVERLLIKQHETMVPNGYNLCAGGEGVFEPSGETRARMSAAAAARTGRVVSEETKARIAAALKGHGFAPETLAKMSAAKIGGRASDATRALLSSMRRGKRLPKRTPEQIEAMAANLRGKKRPPRSAETRKNISEAAKTGWIKRRAAAQECVSS